MNDKWLNYLMIAGLVGIIGVVIYTQVTLRPPQQFPSAPETTGATIDDTFKKQNPPLEQFYQLMDMESVIQSSFRIDADYDELVLIVTLNEPISESQQQFFQWLNDNGYGQIPADKIVLR